MSRPGRLLSINSYHYRRGGADVVYLETDAMFRNAGWDTAVMSMRHPSNLPSEWSEFFVDELELNQSNGLLDKLRKASKVVYSFEAQRRLEALLARFGPDIAHLHNIYHHLSPSVLPALSRHGIPAVLTAHDLKIACPAYKMLNSEGICERCRTGSVAQVVMHRCIHDSYAASAIVAIESALQRQRSLYRRHLAKVICPSRFYVDKLREWGWPAEQLSWVPNAIDSTPFDGPIEIGDYFLFAGRLSPEKGVLTLVEAARRAGVPLRIAGTGPAQDLLRAHAQGHDIVFPGFVGGEALWSLIRGARALVLPSEWYENAPMSILEAFACGTPVIGADIGGIPELIEPGVDGLLFRSGDADSLADALASVAAMSPATLRAMGEAGRDRVRRDHAPQRYFDGVLQVYRSVGFAH
ncbi:MAG: glycosyltransferase family 4 protein [Lautropia sp.]